MSELKILVIEDNAGDLFLVKEYLKRTNLGPLNISHSESLSDALRKIENEEFNVIFLDLFLSDSDGVETFQRLNPLTLQAPVVVLTGLLDERIALEALKHGIQDYLVKGDYDEKLLGKTIRYAIERKGNQKLLERSEEKYKVLFDGNPLPMWAYDIHSLKILMVNQAAILQYGFTKEEFQAMTIIDIRDFGDGESKELAIENLKRDSILSHSGFWRHRKKNHTTIDVEVVSHNIELREGKARLVVAYDITDRKVTEDNLRLFKSAIINTNDAVLITSAGPVGLPAPKIIFANQACIEMSGYSLDELVGKTPKILQGPKTDVLQLSKIRQALIEFKPVEAELINYRKDGTEYWVNFSIVPVANDRGEFTHFVSVQRDVTERKQSQEAIRRNLERLVEERTQELNQALSKEKELVELKNRFVAIASHEFRTPLSTINFATNFLQQHLDRLSSDEVQNKLKRIEKQVQHMTELLEDVITVGRSGLNKIPIVKSNIDLSALIQKIIEDVEQNTKKTHKIEVNYRATLPIIDTDEKLIRNILINLLTNAIKFSPGRNRIQFILDQIDNNIIIVVKDEGIGILPGDKEKLFEAFHRGSNTNAISGTGLGLSIVKKAVDLLNGTIEVNSEVGKGTLFKVVIPIQ